MICAGIPRSDICEAFNVTVDLERHNANLIAGDITGGARARSTSSFTQQSGRIQGRQRICISARPRLLPGGEVHGMCGYYVARTALRKPCMITPLTTSLKSLKCIFDRLVARTSHHFVSRKD